MAKIGRNTPCPCGSGKKYKRCCAGKDAAVASAQMAQQGASATQMTLMNAVTALQKEAAAGRVLHREMGVFFFFTTAAGDAWVLEMTDQDAIQVAVKGQALPTPINENPETIEVNWSHTFALKEKQLEFTTYLDKSSFILNDAPSRELNGAMRRIKKRFSQEQLEQVHLEAADVA